LASFCTNPFIVMGKYVKNETTADRMEQRPVTPPSLSHPRYRLTGATVSLESVTRQHGPAPCAGIVHASLTLVWLVVCVSQVHKLLLFLMSLCVAGLGATGLAFTFLAHKSKHHGSS
jgi:hypothetical protein